MVALFEVGAFTTSMQVIRNDEVLYDRDQAFGGAQLTQLIVRQYGFSPEEAESKKRSGDLPEDYESGVLKPFVDSMAQEVARALQFFFTSTPHNRVDYVMLAGGSAALPGLTDAVTQQTSFPCNLANPFEGMEIGERRAREEDAARGALVPDVLRPGHAEVPAVILINLLPHREAARKRRREMFYAALGASAVAGVVIAGLVFVWYAAQISSQQEKQRILQTEIKRLEAPDQGHCHAAGGNRRRCGPASRRWKTCRPTATCRCTCSTSWSGSCPTAST